MHLISMFVLRKLENVPERNLAHVQVKTKRFFGVVSHLICVVNTAVSQAKCKLTCFASHTRLLEPVS